MISEKFWSHVSALDGVVNPEGCGRLVESLAAGGEAEVRQFANDLATAVRALATPQHLSQAVWDVSEPAAAPALPMSDDVFLYARLAVVAAGQSTWQTVVADANAMSGRWHVADAEELLEVVPQAFRRATGLDWDDELILDPPADSEDPRVGAGATGGHGKWWNWYMSGHMYDVKAERDDFDDAAYQLERAIDADPAWAAWWSNSGVPDLETYPSYTWDGVPKPRLSKGRKVVRVHFGFDAAVLHRTSVQDLPRLAAEHQRVMLQFVQSKLGLPEMPPLPTLP
ncbi:MULTISPECIES: DUF4240 domain-containing protein [Micromonospora]|uniref:DUF4240 domain-containing protein n=1 Tax=Micromonospora TaxID=1873 RepID=UPI001319C5A4|nr:MULTISPECIES: DUF4240 domain-containing protein [Micromonospora]NES17335.1 DUF4240 domain-containing protein [Micromonospora sp. PPF5-17B]NES39833.1 DUF4240 domain-containing protein [Micromonospora solifontis]NES59182.1 DUF4240 domain-containing protein [Micromonospora sp. PPF5-6]